MTMVNDAADEEVKLAQDLLESSNSEEFIQNVLQVVEFYRKKIAKEKISQ